MSNILNFPLCPLQTIKIFWQLVEKWGQEERARLLQFVTGTSMVPPEGFKVSIGMCFFADEYRSSADSASPVVGAIWKQWTSQVPYPADH
jgi:hypothetical protein